MKIICSQNEANALGVVLDASLKHGGIQRLDAVNLIRQSIELEPPTEVTLEEQPCQNTNVSTKES